jgi:hypothetical protein
MHYNDMEDFEKKLESMTKPAGLVQPPREVKMAIISAKRSATMGIWFTAIPCYFLFCVFMKYYFHINLGLFDAMTGLMLDLEKNQAMKWLSPIMLIGLPLVGVALNCLSICHFSLQPEEKLIQISIKLRWLNILVLVLSLGLVFLFVGYMIIENVHHKTIQL